MDFSSPPAPSLPLPPIATQEAIDLSSERSAFSTTLLVEEDEPFSSSPSRPSSPATTAMPTKEGLYSYFPSIHSRKRSYDQLEQLSQPSPKPASVHMQPTRQPVTVTPSSGNDAARTKHTLTKPVGKSAAYLNKWALNRAVEAGTFERSERKWATFKSKILSIDPQSEVDDTNPKCARDVLHVKCGKLLRMATVYDTSRYKRHVQNCKSHTAMAGMHTLDNGLQFVFRQQPGFSSVNSDVCDSTTTLWPCPGLSEDDEPRIETYLLRTTVSSAGGISIDAVAEQMYGTPYKNLSEDQKQDVRMGQVRTHRWSLDHQSRRVFAIGEEPCLQQVPRSNSESSARLRPCRACKALLGYRAFQNAINRNIPDDENRKFTPLLYQAPAMAKCCTRD
ncbi:hypothetical protein V8E53_001327 [Lactarius tabidus]